MRLGLLPPLREAAGQIILRNRHKHAISQATSQRSLPLKKGLPTRIKVANTVTTKTVKLPPARPRREQDETGF